MKTRAFTLLLSLCGLGLSLIPAARADQETVVTLATPFSPPRVSITNDRDYSVRVYALSGGRRYFLAELTPGEHLDRCMAPPVSGRRWVVTSTTEEELGRFTLTTESSCVVLR